MLFWLQLVLANLNFLCNCICQHSDWSWSAVLCRFDGSPLYKSIKSSPYRGRRSVERSDRTHKNASCFFRAPQSAHFHFLYFTRVARSAHFHFLFLPGWHEVQMLRVGPSLTPPQDDLSSKHFLFTIRMTKESHHGIGMVQKVRALAPVNHFQRDLFMCATVKQGIGERGPDSNSNSGPPLLHCALCSRSVCLPH